jgi:hypothetical protein
MGPRQKTYRACSALWNIDINKRGLRESNGVLGSWRAR